MDFARWYSRRYFQKSAWCFLLLMITTSALAQKPDAVKILFIGNSYTYGGGTETDPGLPKYIKDMAEFYNHKMEYDFVVKGGTTLERQWNEGKALEKIQTGKFDYVVLQDQSAITLRNLNSFREFAAKFNEAIKNSGAKTVLYMTWGYAGKPEMGDIVEFEYNRQGKDLGAIVVPCGLAWQIYFEKNSGAELHISDKSHPNGAGVYLNTCVFYRTIFGKIPKMKTYTSEGLGGERAIETTRKLQLVAEEAFCGNADYGKEQRLNQNPYFQSPTADINHIIIYGQSLSTGQQTAPAISVKNYAGNLMLGDQVWSNFSNILDNQNLVFNSMFAAPTISSKKTNADVLADVTIDANNQLNCEPPVVGFANAAKFNFDRYWPGFSSRKFAATSCGEGGRSIEMLMKDCPNRGGKLYAHYQNMITKSKAAADRMNKSINCSAILWMQGEYNYRESKNQGWEPNTPATKNKNQYKTYFLKLVDDMIGEVKSTYSQTKAPVFITYQCGAQYTADFDVPVGMAQLEVANADPRVVLAGPVYPVSDRGGHLCPNGSRWYGEMMAKVYHKTVVEGQQWTPLQPKEITRGNNFVDIEFLVPVPPLRLDTLTLQKAKNYGFGIREAEQEKQIQTISAVSPTKIRIVLTSDLGAGNLEINYAGPATAGNGNLCDSDPFKSFATYQDLTAEGTTDTERNRFKPKYEPRDSNGKIIYGQPYPMQNFCCAFYYAVPAGQSVLKCQETLSRSNSELIFHSSFEGTSRVISNSKDAPAIITPSYVIDDIVGIDNTLDGKNDWVKDLDENPNAGKFLIEYTGGDSTQRFVKIIPEPANPKNHVLQFWLNDSWHATENQQKARIQTDIYEIKNGYKEFYQSQLVFLPVDWNILKSYPNKIGWLTITEFWNNEWWVKDEKYGFRITLGIGKPVAETSELNFILNAEDSGQKEIWHGNNTDVKVPVGKWFTMDYYYKEGNKETGRFYMTITPDGGQKQVIFDIHDFTHNTKDPAPNGVTGYSPQKLYTSKELVAFMKSQGKTLQIYWDDFKLWKNKRP